LKHWVPMLFIIISNEEVVEKKVQEISVIRRGEEMK